MLFVNAVVSDIQAYDIIPDYVKDSPQIRLNRNAPDRSFPQSGQPIDFMRFEARVERVSPSSAVQG